MKYSLIAVAVLFVILFDVVMAKSQQDIYIDSASQFQKWCQQLSYRHFRQKKLQPYNWSASTYRNFNDYQTEGSWKVEGKEREVFCSIRVGAKAKYTNLEIH